MNKKAFTLIEMLVTISIIGILTITASISYSKVRARSRDMKRKNDLLAISTALESYYLINKFYPGEESGCSSSPSDNYNYSSNLACPQPPDSWIPGMDEFIKPMPVEAGPKKGDYFILDNDCDGNDLRNYQYHIIHQNQPTHYYLAARLELDDEELIHRDDGCNIHNITIAPNFTVVVKGYPIYMIYK